MSEYTFETAALKAVTIDAVKYNEEGLKNSLTPEAIQHVVPIAWGKDWVAPTMQYEQEAIVIGSGSKSLNYGANVVIGQHAQAATYTVAIGWHTSAPSIYSVAIGTNTNAANYSLAVGSGANSVQYSVALGGAAKSLKPNTTTIGNEFTETTDSGNVTHTCTTEGTGSITIGAGANTLNTTKTVDGVETTVESSNSVTIGCKAENKGADSVVLGAQAKATAGGTVAIGAGATSLFTSSVSLGSNSKTEGWCSTAVGTNAYGANGGTAIGLKATAYMGLAVGGESVVNKYNAMALGGSAKAIAFSSSAIGDSTKASADYATAIGRNATAADYGATVIRSTAEDGTYTQLYFSGANTPLAKKYFPTAWEQKQDVDPETNEPLFDENGEPVMVDDKDKPIAGEAMMGFVAKDKDGNIIARGANMLSALFPYYTGAEDDPSAPTTMSLGGEKPEPVAFHPSDLDMPVEEPTTPEMEEYTPLPVYPIVEPEIEEIDE